MDWRPLPDLTVRENILVIVVHFIALLGVIFLLDYWNNVRWGPPARPLAATSWSAKLMGLCHGLDADTPACVRWRADNAEWLARVRPCKDVGADVSICEAGRRPIIE